MHGLRKYVLLELLDGAKPPARRLKGPADRVEEAKTRRHGGRPVAVSVLYAQRKHGPQMAVDSVLMPLDECLVVDVKELHELGGSLPCDERTLREDHLIILDGLLHERRFDCVAGLDLHCSRDSAFVTPKFRCVSHDACSKDSAWDHPVRWERPTLLAIIRGDAPGSAQWSARGCVRERT